MRISPRRLLQGACLLAPFACSNAVGPDARRDPATPVSMRPGVAGRVDGVPIRLAAVRDLAARAHQRPEHILRTLQDEFLLARRAEKAVGQTLHGPRRFRFFLSAERRAAVQALLADTVETSVSAVDEQALRLEYAQTPDRFNRPERRRSVHILLRPTAKASTQTDEAIRAFIHDIYTQLTDGPNPVAALRAMRVSPPTPLPADATFQFAEVPALARSDHASPRYLAALFASNRRGLHPPIRTEHGWTLLAVTEIIRAVHLTRAAGLSRLRAERLAEARAEALRQLLSDLEARTRTIIRDDVMDWLEPASATLPPEARRPKPERAADARLASFTERRAR